MRDSVSVTQCVCRSVYQMSLCEPVLCVRVCASCEQWIGLVVDGRERITIIHIIKGIQTNSNISTLLLCRPEVPARAANKKSSMF